MNQSFCKLCKKRLTNEISISIGYGKICAKKSKIHYPTKNEFFNSKCTFTLVNESLSDIKEKLPEIAHKHIIRNDLKISYSKCIKLEQFCLKLAKKLHFNVIYKNTMQNDNVGLCKYLDNLIIIKKREWANELGTFLHELSHASGSRRHLNRNIFDRLNEEFIAEMTKFRILQHFKLVKSGDMGEVMRYILQLVKYYNYDINTLSNSSYLSKQVNNILEYINLK